MTGKVATEQLLAVRVVRDSLLDGNHDPDRRRAYPLPTGSNNSSHQPPGADRNPRSSLVSSHLLHMVHRHGPVVAELVILPVVVAVHHY
eukprot:SAG31_NODE_506_length_14749_cov_8.119181_14_plen_88_part_01